MKFGVGMAPVEPLQKVVSVAKLAEDLGFSTVVHADLILVFEAGRVVEMGTFAALKNEHGLFQRLLQAGELHEHEGRKPEPRA